MRATRNPLVALAAVLAAAALSIPLGGCFGAAARDNVTLPAAALAVDSVFDHARLGIDDAVSSGELPEEDGAIFLDQLRLLEEAFDSGDRELVADRGNPLVWAAFPPYARAGIDLRVERGDFGEPFDSPEDEDEIPEAAETFYEEVTQFSAALIVLSQELGDD